MAITVIAKKEDASVGCKTETAIASQTEGRKTGQKQEGKTRYIG
jgi:hypothetical protein